MPAIDLVDQAAADAVREAIAANARTAENMTAQALAHEEESAKCHQLAEDALARNVSLQARLATIMGEANADA